MPSTDPVNPQGQASESGSTGPVREEPAEITSQEQAPVALGSPVAIPTCDAGSPRESDNQDGNSSEREAHPASTCTTPSADGQDLEGAAATVPVTSDGMEHFQRLRRRMLVSTLIATAAAVPLCWLLFDAGQAISLLVGALAGFLYLLLLARSVARLGGDRRSVGKVQLLVPIVLVLASSRLPQLELVPALVGFLLYKPALLVQAYLDR